ncbi:uncharacterized protein LOC117175372 [Belonocnema kinseyi]|uniref:uncharacterized protein LOC117175372 n=1 Tax=Belonocnema kinseyi TaxID=2817044 RepID=UPI00143D5037|nr:uncharacterized protein LOC117175372 [Belonocnema kinseyi]
MSRDASSYGCPRDVAEVCELRPMGDEQGGNDVGQVKNLVGQESPKVDFAHQLISSPLIHHFETFLTGNIHRQRLIVKLGLLNITDLSFELVKPLLRRRLEQPRIRAPLRMQIEEFLTYDEIPEVEDPRDFIADNKLAKHTRCEYYHHSFDRKTWYKCLRCNRAMSHEHTAKLCQYCVH